ncbi:MAG TPA: bifunctional diaminohydroxyphosphoribosylaminopyrimidine deaminase/5-amino-6-(5-phosphoribosylamino)uracil reductase RibD [Nitrospirota bacterium]|nr:bifunctional diaminohydroxyphosphoribosylaminopyrimidine deaminase/5-amino-6-(5-phosphoribosylamino)uracil reductase RibD [Nitrospirota bacterium]
MHQKALDEKYMRMALRLAARSRGLTSPNPMVGAVVVRDNKVISRGYHRRAGGLHAEAIALGNAGEAAAGATLYVTLEPCSHTDKRTPPCTPLVVESGIKRVVVAMIDPNPKVSGEGIKALRSAGIDVVTGICEAESKTLNEAFIKYISTGMPFVSLKIAQTLDGKIATALGESKWITGEQARQEGHRLRHENDAILVGINTVLADDPSLTARIPKGRNPVRVIVDTHLRTPLHAKVMSRKPPVRTIVATLRTAPAYKVKKLERAGAEVLLVRSLQGRVDIKDLMKLLGKLGVMSVLIEGGAEINASALTSGIVDKVVMFIAPILMTSKEALSSIGGASPRKLSQAVRLTGVTSHRVGSDLMITGYIVRCLSETIG